MKHVKELKAAYLAIAKKKTMIGVEVNLAELHSNKRMQTDQPTRYARGLAADAGR